MLWGASVLSSIACQSEESEFFIYELGQEATVFSETSLCEGDLLTVKESVVRIERLLDAHEGDAVPIFVHNSLSSLGCQTGAAGCFKDGEVHTLWQALDHELVHAIANRVGVSSPFWNEGAAEALSGRTRRGDTDVAANLELLSVDLDYSTAGHFVRWTVETYGLEGIREILQGRTFSETYGMDLDDAILSYETSAPWSYPAWVSCRGSGLGPTGTDRFELSTTVDCADADSTSRGTRGVGAIHTLDIESPGTYRLMLDGGAHVSMVACQLDILEDQPDSEFSGDIIREVEWSSPTRFESGVAHEVRLEPGTIQLLFGTDEGVEQESLQFELALIGP